MPPKTQKNTTSDKKPRIASDSFGELEIPENAYWGAQTQRSLQHFNIGNHHFSHHFIDALVSIKRACAYVNYTEKLLQKSQYQGITDACDKILSGQHYEQFPLSVWQTGSGTQTNMNVNEVISFIANETLAKKSGTYTHIHPNDHINMSQSSNDVFPTAMHISTAQATHAHLFVAMDKMDNALAQKQTDFHGVVTVGRTHLMDALPLTVGSVFSAFRAQLAEARAVIQESLNDVYQLAIGGTAVGSGCNAPTEFSPKVCEHLAAHYKLPFIPHQNLYAAVSSQDGLLRYSAALKQLASVLFKMANDFRLLGSGPRCGFNEWQLPANEPGSSMMPGKVNPTQCEALSMVCLQVFGNDLSVSLGAAHSQLQLNVYRPMIIHNVLESIALLSDAMKAFSQFCIEGLTLNETTLASNMQRNLSLITLLAPQLGYDAAAKIAGYAHEENTSLAEAAAALNVCSESEFNRLLQQQL